MENFPLSLTRADDDSFPSPSDDDFCLIINFVPSLNHCPQTGYSLFMRRTDNGAGDQPPPMPFIRQPGAAAARVERAIYQKQWRARRRRPFPFPSPPSVLHCIELSPTPFVSLNERLPARSSVVVERERGRCMQSVFRFWIMNVQAQFSTTPHKCSSCVITGQKLF